ncbi:MAG: hypothetical protein CMJ39_01970 [Phycisphaerae bacterium]|nr:hypothetical protein [Phycisphaerae bacterium]
MKDSMKARNRVRRGMTFIETVLAISITAMVGGAITTMMAAVTDEVESHHLTRSQLIQNGLAQSRLSSYIARSHCVLELTDDSVTLWLEDSRDSGTVHASEIRWIKLDPATGVLESHFVCFPDSWSESSRILGDTEFNDYSHVDWTSVLLSFQNRDLICTLPIAEEVADLTFTGNAPSPDQITLIESTLHHSMTTMGAGSRTAEAIRVHRLPGGEG